MAISSRKKMVAIKFTPPVTLQDVREVKVAGDFTNWEKGAIVMSKSGKRGEWLASVSVTSGDHQYHQYRYLLDGKWFTDPLTEHVMSPLGTENSLLRIN